MREPTFARYCCGPGMMELERKYPDGNELVVCHSCGRREEIATSGFAVRPPREAVRTQATADAMAEILAGLPATI
jgi:hypothetical protein